MHDGAIVTMYSW